MAEHPELKSMGGCYQADVSPCTHCVESGFCSEKKYKFILKAYQTFQQPRSSVLWDGSWFHMESVTPEQKFAAAFGRAPPSPSIPSSPSSPSSSSSLRSALPVSSSPLWSMYVVGYFSAWELGSGSETRLITPLCSRQMAQSTSRLSRG